MCSDFATFIGDRSWHPHWDKRWQTPYPRSPAMVDPLWASMSAEGWRATQDYSRSVSAHWSQRAGGSQGSWNGWWLWRFFKDLHFLEHFGATRKMETCLSDPCGSRFISLNARQARAIQAHWNTVHRHIMRDCRSSIGLKKPASLFPTSMAPRGGRVFLCSKGHPFLPVFRSWPKGPKADSIMDGFDASLGSFQVLLQVFAASIQQLEHPGSWNSRRPCLEAVLGWWWCLSLELQWGV